MIGYESYVLQHLGTFKSPHREDNRHLLHPEEMFGHYAINTAVVRAKWILSNITGNNGLMLCGN